MNSWTAEAERRAERASLAEQQVQRLVTRLAARCRLPGGRGEGESHNRGGPGGEEPEGAARKPGTGGGGQFGFDALSDLERGVSFSKHTQFEMLGRSFGPLS